jgi:hypothetical protein
VPQVEASTAVRSNTARRLRRNPIAASVSQYDYIEGAGIDIIPDAATLDTLEPFQTSNRSIQLSGTGAPYAGGTGITISA